MLTSSLTLHRVPSLYVVAHLVAVIGVACNLYVFRTPLFHQVSSSEWKRALRWMMGDKNWDKRDRTLHDKTKNGLELLADRGLEETRWALESDRFTR